MAPSEGPPPPQKCTCVWRADKYDDAECPRDADPTSGEALLCKECMDHDEHMRVNMVPKRLPKRRITEPI